MEIILIIIVLALIFFLRANPGLTLEEAWETIKKTPIEEWALPAIEVGALIVVVTIAVVLGGFYLWYRRL